MAVHTYTQEWKRFNTGLTHDFKFGQVWEMYADNLKPNAHYIEGKICVRHIHIGWFSKNQT